MAYTGEVKADVRYDDNEEEWEDENNENYGEEAEQEVLKELERMYIETDMNIDSCQGCMSGLEKEQEKVNIYGELLCYLSGNRKYITENRSRMLEELYADDKKQREEEESKENKFYEHIKYTIELMTSDNKKDKTLLQCVDKINSILDLLKENKNIK